MPPVAPTSNGYYSAISTTTLPVYGPQVVPSSSTSLISTTNGSTQNGEEISTIFVVGFPEDMHEREFQNMFIFSSGFEAATLKVPSKDGEEDQTAIANGNPRKQTIGFAKFRTRQAALEARDTLSGRRVDAEKGSVLKAEMAKKNLHTKRGLSNEQQGQLILAQSLQATQPSQTPPPVPVPAPTNSYPMLASKRFSLAPPGNSAAYEAFYSVPLLSELLPSDYYPDFYANPDLFSPTTPTTPAIPPITNSTTPTNITTSNTNTNVTNTSINISTNSNTSTSTSSSTNSNSSSNANINTSINTNVNSITNTNTSNTNNTNGTNINTTTTTTNKNNTNITNTNTSTSTSTNSTSTNNTSINSTTSITTTNTNTNANTNANTNTNINPNPNPNLNPNANTNANTNTNTNTNTTSSSSTTNPIIATPSDSVFAARAQSFENRNPSVADIFAPMPSTSSSRLPAGFNPGHRFSSKSVLDMENDAPFHYLSKSTPLHSSSFTNVAAFVLEEPSAYDHTPTPTSITPIHDEGLTMPGGRFSGLTINTAITKESHLMSPPPNVTSPTTHRVFNMIGSMNPSDQNPPCNTLYVGNLPPNTNEDELKILFSKCSGYKRMSFRNKSNGPMCFVEFDDVQCATQALQDLHGNMLSNSVKGGIRLSFSKNPLGVRQQNVGNGPNSSTSNGIMHFGMTSPLGPHGFPFGNRRESLSFDPQLS
ncbi:hypothetical protein F4703DRAFT_1792888 [Phycomyces blakesleeanus]